jgi:hypothetical protein
MLKQLLYKLPVAAGKMHMMAPAGYLKRKTLKQMNVSRVPYVDEDSQNKLDQLSKSLLKPVFV